MLSQNRKMKLQTPLQIASLRSFKALNRHITQNKNPRLVVAATLMQFAILLMRDAVKRETRPEVFRERARMMEKFARAAQKIK